jgi:undecaprenyl-diphosphatase
LKRSSQRRAARVLGAMLLAGLVSGVAGTGLRSIIGRTRPEVSVEQGWFGPRKDGRWIIGRHAYASFPSGHASIAAGLGFMAFVWGARAGGLGLVFALAVAWSRFHLGAHRASDVWAGLLVGALTVTLLWPLCWDWAGGLFRTPTFTALNGTGRSQSSSCRVVVAALAVWDVARAIPVSPV